MRASERRAIAAQRRRLALRMWQVEGKSYAAIGKIMGVSRQRVFQMVGRALRFNEKPLPARMTKNA